MMCSPGLGPTPLVHPGLEARGRRSESLLGSSWVRGQEAAPAGPPWYSGTGSHKPPLAVNGRQIRLEHEYLFRYLTFQ